MKKLFFASLCIGSLALLAMESPGDELIVRDNRPDVLAALASQLPVHEFVAEIITHRRIDTFSHDFLSKKNTVKKFLLLTKKPGGMSQEHFHAACSFLAYLIINGFLVSSRDNFKMLINALALLHRFEMSDKLVEQAVESVPASVKLSCRSVALEVFEMLKSAYSSGSVNEGICAESWVRMLPYVSHNQILAVEFFNALKDLKKAPKKAKIFGFLEGLGSFIE